MAFNSDLLFFFKKILFHATCGARFHSFVLKKSGKLRISCFGGLSALFCKKHDRKIFLLWKADFVLAFGECHDMAGDPT